MKALPAGAGAQGLGASRPALQLVACLVVGIALGSLLTSLGSQSQPQSGQVAADLAAIKELLQRRAPAPAAAAVIDVPPPPAAAGGGEAGGRGAVFIANQLAARNVSFAGLDTTILALLNDEYVGAEILATGQPFDKETLKMMLGYIRPGTTVVDAGCNFGSYSVFFATKVGPGGAVHCFEPQRKMAQLANANSLVNGLSPVMRVYNYALSFAPGSVEMAAKLPDGAFGGSALKDVEKAGGQINYGGMKLGKGGESTAAITLDSLNITNISFMKVDVQGAEKLMFYGAQETIKRSLPYVVYEHLEGWDVTPDMIERMKIPKEVLDWSIDDFFKGLGYTAVRSGVEMLQKPPARGNAHRRAAARKLA